MLEYLKNWIVSRKWSTPPVSGYYFFTFPPIASYQNKLVSGDPEVDCYDWSIQTYFKDHMPFENCLSLVCGHGHVERLLAEKGVAKHLLGLDISEGAVNDALRLAREAGFDNIEYKVADVNKIQLEPESYDLIVAVGALHHLSELEHVIGQIHKALRPGGFLMTNEFVGPTYNQFGPRQVELINALVHLIPHDRRDRFEYTYLPGWLWFLRFKGAIHYVTPLRKLFRSINPFRDNRFGKVYDYDRKAYWLATDPSESVRSAEVIPILKQHFSDIDIRYYNGSLLMQGLDQTYFATYKPDDPDHKKLNDLLCTIEKTMVDINELQPDCAHMIAWK